MEQKVAGRKTGRLVLIDDVDDEIAEEAIAKMWLKDWRQKMIAACGCFLPRLKRTE